MWNAVKAHAKTSITVALLLAAALGWIVGKRPWHSPYIALPAEYVYLDDGRVDGYLGQLQNGLAKSEQQTITAANSASATVAAGSALSLGGSITDTQATEQTVTPDEGDRLYQLLEDLHRQFSDRLHVVDLHDPDPVAALESVPETDFVEVRNARLAMPRFALPVPALSLGVQTLYHGERAIRATTLSAIISRYPGEIRAYLKGFGANATFPLRVVFDGKAGDHVLVPVALSGLLAPSSLIDGNVTIFGVVVKQIRTDTAPSTEYDIEDHSYFDAAAAVVAERALRKIPPHLAHALQLFHGHNAVAQLVDNAEDLNAPGTVILPIAIYV